MSTPQAETNVGHIAYRREGYSKWAELKQIELTYQENTSKTLKLTLDIVWESKTKNDTIILKDNAERTIVFTLDDGKEYTGDIISYSMLLEHTTNTNLPVIKKLKIVFKRRGGGGGGQTEPEDFEYDETGPANKQVITNQP